MLKMVDVYSGSPRYFATQSGTDITMVKATQGTGYVNPYCDIDYQAAKKKGKLLGFYHYCSGGNAKREAQYFYKNTKNYNREAVPAVDWESSQNSSWGDCNYVRTFVNEYHHLTGVWPLIYVQQSAIYQVANCAKDCGLWVAWYASMSWRSWSTPAMNFSIRPWKYFTAWQFTGGDMDRSIVNVTRQGWKNLANPPHKKAKPSKYKWQPKKGIFILNKPVRLHTSPNIAAHVIAKLAKGDGIAYDATLKGPLRLWLRQPRKNGKYGYIVARDKKGHMNGTLK